jgi:hypothetical protein
MKRLLASLLTIGLLAACSSMVPAQAPVTPTVVGDADLDRLSPDLPIFREGLVASAQSILPAMEGASVYRVEFTVQDDLVRVLGKEEVAYTNRENAPLDEIQFRLYPNLLGGKMEVSNLRVDGTSVTPGYGLLNSLLIVPLERSLAVGQSIRIAMDFALEVPTDVELNYGVLAYYDNVLTLAHAYPVIPVHDASGWNAEIPPQSGDMTYNDAAFYLVTVTAPEGLILVGSGVESAPVRRGRQNVWNIAAGPARDFFVAASRDFEVMSETVGEVTVNSYAPKSLQDGNRAMLSAGAHSLELFNEQYGLYPYTEFDIVVTPTLALGVEYPGATAIAARILEGEYGDATSAYLESTVVHEVAHQWFYNLVGNDQLDEPWLDESLAQFVTWEYYEQAYGSQAAAGFEASLRDRWMRVGNAPIPIGQPVASYAGREYGAIVYGRGAFFFEALQTEMGASAFDAFLRDYVSTYSWGLATAEGLKSLAEKHCNCNLTPLFEEWVY